MHSYHDLNGDVGGYIKKDKLWWYSSLRDQDIRPCCRTSRSSRSRPRLKNVTGKGTYSLNQNNKLVGFAQWGQKQQPNRLDTFLVGADRRHSQQRRLDLEPVRTGPTPTKWAGTASSATRCSSRCTAASSTTCGRTRETRKRPPFRTSPPTSSAAATRTAGSGHHAESDARLAQLLQRRLGGQSQLQVRRRAVQRALRRPPRPGRPRPGAGRRADGSAKRQPSEVLLFQSPSTR